MIVFRLALGLLLVVLGSSALAQNALDPESLVGEWAGIAALIGPRGGVTRGPVALAIERVEGGKVYGRIETPGGGSPTTFVGTLRGNMFTFYTGRFETALTVVGKRLYGVRRAGGDGDNTELGLDKVEKK